MTFKHTKFEDSPTMRALEKVAREKGLVKDEPLRKTASTPKKPNYTPSTNLMENVLKLCAGLRNQGLVKEAAELETNFLNYKQAQTLYETSKEKGEDLVQAAHPKGSHKLEGVEGDAVVEDILDQHMKHIQMVEKKPTGKLSTAQAISAVKRVLGQGQPQEQETEDSVIRKKEELLDSMPKQFGGIVQMVTIHGDSEWATIDKESIQEKASKVNSVLGVRPFNRPNLNTLKGAYNDFISWASDSGAFEDSIWHSSEHNAQSKALWKEYVSGLAGSFSAKIAQLDKLLAQQENIQVGREQGTYKEPSSSVITIPEVTVASDPMVVKLQGLVGRLQSFKGVLSISRDPQATKWIDDEIKEISAMQDRIDDIAENQPAQRKTMDARYQRDYATFEQEVNQFQKDWVD